jgi:hypothetical protein
MDLSQMDAQVSPDAWMPGASLKLLGFGNLPMPGGGSNENAIRDMFFADGSMNFAEWRVLLAATNSAVV